MNCCTGNCRQGRACPNRHQVSISNIATTGAIVALFALVLAVAGPSIDDNSTEIATAQALEDSINAEATQARFERAAQAVCGENGAFVQIDSQTVQCFTHRGSKTITAKVSL